MRVLIVGAGYTGHRLAVDLLASGHDVLATGRGPRGFRVPYEFERFDLNHPARLGDLLEGHGWQGEGFRVVFTAGPPLGDSIKSSLRMFTRFVEQLEDRNLTGFAYVSSTSVYGDADGAWVDETHPLEPVSRSGELKVRCERMLRERLAPGVPVILLRPGGIYGPGRSGADRYLDPGYRLVGDGEKWTNRIHVVDLVRAAARLIRLEDSDAFNVVDGHPVRLRELVEFLYRRTGRDPDTIQRISWEEAERRYSEMRLGLLKPQKRVSPRKMVRELGFEFRYPSVYVGMRELLR